MAKHTDLPWVYRPEHPGFTIGTWIEDQRGYTGFGTVAARVPSSSETGEADAEFITRAVNAHDALLEAARLTVAWWENPDYYNPERLVPGFVQAARTALAKVEGRAE